MPGDTRLFDAGDELVLQSVEMTAAIQQLIRVVLPLVPSSDADRLKSSLGQSLTTLENATGRLENGLDCLRRLVERDC